MASACGIKKEKLQANVVVRYAVLATYSGDLANSGSFRGFNAFRALGVTSENRAYANKETPWDT